MTPMATTRLYGRVMRQLKRFGTTSEKLQEVIDFFHATAMDSNMKTSVRMEAGKNYILAESLNQKDEHKLLGLLRDSAVEQDGNRFLVGPSGGGETGDAGKAPST